MSQLRNNGLSVLLLAAALCALALAGCNQNAAPVAPAGSQTVTGSEGNVKMNMALGKQTPTAPGRYVSKSGGFSLAPPAGWSGLDASMGGKTAHAFTGPATDGFATNLVVEDGSAPSTSEMVAGYKKAIEATGGAMTLEGESAITVDGEPGIQLKIHNQGSANGNPFDAEQFTAFADHNGKGCALTYSVAASSPGTAESDFAKIVSTVKWE